VNTNKETQSQPGCSNVQVQSPHLNISTLTSAAQWLTTYRIRSDAAHVVSLIITKCSKLYKTHYYYKK